MNRGGDRDRDREVDNDFKRGDLINEGEDDRNDRRPRGGFRGGDRERGVWGDRGDRGGDRDRDREPRKDSGGWNKGEVINMTEERNNNSDFRRGGQYPNQDNSGKRSFVNKRWGEDEDRNDKWDKGGGDSGDN